MKKLSNRMSVKQSSTKEGQRELLREHTNKINEMIVEYDARLHTLEQRINNVAEYTAMRSTGDCMCPCHIKPLDHKGIRCCNKINEPQEDDNRVHPSSCDCRFCDPLFNEPIKPQEDCVCKNPITVTSLHKGIFCAVCNKPIKPKKDIREKIAVCIYENTNTIDKTPLELADKILTIVRGNI